MIDGPKTSPSFLSSLPSQPITDDIVKQIGENDNPKFAELWVFGIIPWHDRSVPAGYGSEDTCDCL